MGKKPEALKGADPKPDVLCSFCLACLLVKPVSDTWPKITCESGTMQPFVWSGPSLANLQRGSVEKKAWRDTTDLRQLRMCLNIIEQLSKLEIIQYLCEVSAALHFVLRTNVLDIGKCLVGKAIDRY